MPFIPKANADVEQDPKHAVEDRPTHDAEPKALEDLRRLLEQSASARQVAQLIAKHPKETEQMMALVHQMRGSHFAAQVARELERLRSLSAFLPRHDDGTVDDDDGTVDSKSPTRDDGTVQEDDGTVDSPVRRPPVDDGTVSDDDGTVSTDDGTVEDRAALDDGTVDTPIRRGQETVPKPPVAHGTSKRRKP